MPPDETAFRSALAADPTDAAAWAGMAGLAATAGRIDLAVRFARIAAAQRPDLGHGYRALADLPIDRAAACAAWGAMLTPQDAAAWRYAGMLAGSRGDFRRTAAALARLLALEPGASADHQAFAMAADALGRPETARRWFTRAVAVDPTRRPARRALATQLYAMSRIEELDAVVAADPGDRVLALKGAMAMALVPRDAEEIATRRRSLDRLLDRAMADPPPIGNPLIELGITNFALAYHDLDNRPLQEKTAALLRAACPMLTYESPHLGRGQGGGRVRLGIVTEFAGDHTIGRLAHRLIAELPADRFEKFLIATPSPNDPVFARSCAGVERFLPFDADIVRMQAEVAALGCDILLYLDLGMSPATYFLAFARLAPVQVTTWGHADTSGIDSVDAFLSCAAMEPPNPQRHYSERLIALDGTTFHCRPEHLDGPFKGRAELGLPDATRLYLCPQTRYKFHPDFDRVLIDILNRDRDGRLVLLAAAQADHDRRFLARIARRDAKAAERIVILPQVSRRDFIALSGACDVVLDVPQYSGGFSTLEMFAAAAPVVTRPGRMMRGRHTAGFYKLMGFTDLIAPNDRAYVDLALSIARDRDRREAARERIAATRDRVWDHPATVPAFAAALEDFVRGR